MAGNLALGRGRDALGFRCAPCRVGDHEHCEIETLNDGIMSPSEFIDTGCHCPTCFPPEVNVRQLDAAEALDWILAVKATLDCKDKEMPVYDGNDERPNRWVLQPCAHLRVVVGRGTTAIHLLTHSWMDLTSDAEARRFQVGAHQIVRMVNEIRTKMAEQGYNPDTGEFRGSPQPAEAI